MPLTATEIEAIVEENFAEDIKLPSDVSSWTESQLRDYLEHPPAPSAAPPSPPTTADREGGESPVNIQAKPAPPAKVEQAAPAPAPQAKPALPAKVEVAPPPSPNKKEHAYPVETPSVVTPKPTPELPKAEVGVPAWQMAVAGAAVAVAVIGIMIVRKSRA